jgi:hypothetical protein
MSCSSTATGDPATDISYRVVTNAISPLRPDLTTTSATAARTQHGPERDRRVLGEAAAREHPFRPGIGGRNGPAAGWPSAPIADWAGWSRRVNQCHIGGSGPSGGRGVEQRGERGRRPGIDPSGQLDGRRLPAAQRFGQGHGTSIPHNSKR